MNKKISFTVLLLSLTVILAALLVGCSAAAPSTKYIGLEKARQIALERAGVSAADARWEDREFDLDDGTPIYELGFRANGYEYDCDVHAVTGAVLDYHVERAGA